MARIQHVTITVPSEDLIEPAAQFYALLGGLRLQRPEMLVQDTPGCWMGFGDTQVHVIVGDSQPGKAHFALDAGADYDDLLNRLDAAGFGRRDARKLWGERRCFYRDPAGNLVEVFERPPESIPAAP